MSLLAHLNPVMDHLRKLRQFLPHNFKISTTHKVVIVSVTTSVALIGLLARHMRRKKQIVDPTKLKRSLSKRTRASGLRSPNGDVISQASSGRRSGAYSGHMDRITIRQGSVISEKASLTSGSLVSGGLAMPEAG
ncbi:hypothetical protein AMK59_6921, partial [Oryctes borbonicus]